MKCFTKFIIFSPWRTNNDVIFFITTLKMIKFDKKSLISKISKNSYFLNLYALIKNDINCIITAKI